MVSIFEACLARTARCARLSRASSFARVCVARVYDIHARLFFTFFLARSRVLSFFSFVPLLCGAQKREIFNKKFPCSFGNGRRAENDCTRRLAKERRVLSCLQYVWARVRDDKFQKNNKGEKGLARKRTNASRSRFSATLPRLSVTLFLKFS